MAGVAVMFYTRNGEVLDSNLSQNTGYPDRSYHDFSQSLQANTMILSTKTFFQFFNDPAM